MADSKELVIISGKGGTGKTSLVACLASLFKARVVAGVHPESPDLNVSAPDFSKQDGSQGRMSGD